jgi:hypothetical protein
MLFICSHFLPHPSPDSVFTTSKKTNLCMSLPWQAAWHATDLNCSQITFSSQSCCWDFFQKRARSGGGCQLTFHFSSKDSLIRMARIHSSNVHTYAPDCAQTCAPWSMTHFAIKGSTWIMYVVQQVHCSLHQCSQKLMILIVMALPPFHLTEVAFLILTFQQCRFCSCSKGILIKSR